MEEDQDSLFGSPPPSPRGRSPSPTLAFPSSRNEISGICAQNVGAIALTGSHDDSEHPITPLALSMSATARPMNRQAARGQRSSTSVPPRASAHKRAGSAPQQRKKRTSAPPEVAPPEIVFPDASQPLPPNFLRSQTALLGVAGLVSGVRPDKLPKRSFQGATSSNPIVVQDDQRPTRPWKGKLVDTVLPPNLPRPSQEEIIKSFLQQKDLVPLISGLVKLRQNGQRSTRNTPPPTKRRKLSSVPAGAADWDVPYPFSEGEGPAEYHETWEKEREKKLLSDLIDLVKRSALQAAARKAALDEDVRKLAAHLHQLQKRGDESTYVSRERDTSIVLADSSNSSQWYATGAYPHYPQQDVCSNPPTQQVQGNDLDQFIHSLFMSPSDYTSNTTPFSAAMDHLPPPSSSTPTVYKHQPANGPSFAIHSCPAMSSPSFDIDLTSVPSENVDTAMFTPSIPLTPEILSLIPEAERGSSSIITPTPCAAQDILPIEFSPPGQDMTEAQTCYEAEAIHTSKSTGTFNSEDIQQLINKAKEKRNELEKAITKARIELRDVTIEQEVLSRVAKRYSTVLPQ